MKNVMKVGLVLIVLAGVTQAGLVVPTNAWATSEYTGAGALNTINGSGVWPDQTHRNYWLDMWLSNGQTVGQAITFDLGAPTDLTGSLIWNFNQLGETDRGVNEFEILVSTDTDENTYTSLGLFNLAEASGNDGDIETQTGGEPAQLISFDATGVRLVKFAINSNYSDGFGVGLSEVRFVPEPATMVLLGLGGLLSLRRRRNCR